jgi:ABC-2 type transport system ATP-binding protein
MRARLAFSVVTRLEEPILLVDEVLAVGDRAFRRKCAGVMENMLADGRTLLLVSHNERDLRRLCTRGIYLREGAVVLDGPIDDVLKRYEADSDREQ